MTRKSGKLPMPEAPAAAEPASTGSQLVDVQIDLSGLTWGDMNTLLTWDGRFTTDVITLVDHVVVGGVKHLPFLATLDPIMNRVQSEIEARMNPGEGAKN